MTFGIDIASSQRDIDLVKAKAQGVEFVIVKMGGFNVTPQYVAPHYKTQIDRAMAAGLPKGHYYLIGKGQTPEAQAEFFVKNLYRFDVTRDVLALDNEHLDGNGTRWGDSDAARFTRRVIALTGIAPHRVWHYAGAGDYRATGAWPEVEAAGVRFWWAAYGKYPTKQTPDHQPDIAGAIRWWDVHQFTSRSKVAGYEVDGNYSPHTVSDLFGGVSMALNNYRLRSPSTVILEDDRDPYVSWRNHLARTNGLRGGVDIVAPVDTPIYARTDGVMLHVPNDGSAGNSCRFEHLDNPGWRDVFSHLSRYVGVSGQHFKAGDIVAYTGDSGGVSPHLHWHLVDPSGVRRNPWDYFTEAGIAGDIGTIIDEKEADVAVHKTFQNATDFYIRPSWQRFPWQSSPREENIAVGTGAGLFDVVLNLYLKEFTADAQIEGRLVVQDATTGAERHQYLFTVDGSPSGEVRTAVPARVVVPPKSRLFLELRTLHGADPRLDLWGADIAVLTVS